ncbi:mediator complex subunit 14 [Brevipalpus obovatus]|uniref:mediator complex subunit 14 n=1 Tax=Brevipalpus obovatus TaxID=246614 RepID=UPI003D9F89F6
MSQPMALVEVNSFPPANRPPMSTISLSKLVDLTIQRTYNDLIILTELLPRKSDIERKIEIVKFANRTRQLFIRLLALVKWAGNASKVEKCSNIVAFLDKQAMLYVETADILAKMARENLVQARLPSLQLPAAVEVLTLGTYSRLPTCIRDRIVPPDPISYTERKSTLQRLNQIIQQRLVTSNLTPQMKNFKIEHGRVTFHVDHEFEMSLTLMGDGPSIPWRVLSIDFLVEDKETGEGRDLVHPLQINFIQNLIQSRLNDNSKSLMDPYTVLHAFCLSLQLEVLQAQAVRLIRERLGDLIKIEEYNPGKRLSLSYWRHQEDPRSEIKNEAKPPCRLTVEVDSQDLFKPLQISHSPDLESRGIITVNDAIKSDLLSIEKLLIHTTHERARQDLTELKKRLEDLQYGQCNLSGSPPVLQISIVDNCMLSERLLLTVDPFTGHILGHIPQFDDVSLADEIQATLKKDVMKWSSLFQKLKVLIICERIKKTSELMSVHVYEKLPFLTPCDHEVLKDPDTTKLFIQFHRHQSNYLLVTIKNQEDRKGPHESPLRYFLLSLKSLPLETMSHLPYEVKLPKVYAKLTLLIELDILSIRGKCRLNGVKQNFNSFDILGKRKLQLDDQPVKKPRLTHFFMQEFAYLISFCEEKLTFGVLSAELQKKGICHHLRTTDEPGYSNYIDIIQYPPDSFGPPSKLRSNLISCTIRQVVKGAANLRTWLVLWTFYNAPSLSRATKDKSFRKVVTTVHDFSTGSVAQITQMVNDLIYEWTAISKLYDIVHDYVEHPNLANFLNSIDIKPFSYKKLTIGYGPMKNYLVSILWRQTGYQLGFGLCGMATSNSNPHTIVAFQLQHEFNQHHSIAVLMQVLNATLSPLLTLQGLMGLPLLGVVTSRPKVIFQSICIVPQSSTHIRLIYRNTYCVDIILSLDGLVAIRDGAFSLFDKAKVLEELSPIQGLKAFLSKFVDRNATQMRRLSQTEDDNPPSPIAHMDTVESYLFQAGPQNQIASPMGGGLASGSDPTGTMMSSGGSGPPLGPGMRNPRQSMVSHPNTPASPHNSVLSQNTCASSPNTSFPLASPPSHGGYQGPGSAGQITLSPSVPNLGSHPEQSPGNIFGVNSPMNPLHAPSPSFLPAPSPSGPNTNIHHQQNPSHDHSVNSPYASNTANLSMPSPAPVPWPNSPSLPRPSPTRPMSSGPSPVAAGLGASPQMNAAQHPYHSNVQSGHMPLSAARFLPQRSWAAAIPTILTHQGLENMCKSNAPLEAPPAPHHNGVYASMSQLERFLGCVFMRKTLQRVLTSDNGFQVITSNPTPGIIQFRNETLQFKITIHPISMQSLQIDIRPWSEHENPWAPEELEILKRFFETKVVCAPFKPNSFIAYTRLLNAPLKIVKDCIQIMRLEMYHDPNLKWTVQLGLTIPPSLVGLMPGMSAIMLVTNNNITRILFFLNFTRVNLPPNIEPQTIVVPFLYSGNNLQIAKTGETTPNPVYGVISEILKRYNEYCSMQSGDFQAIRAIREIMMSELIPVTIQ